MRIDNCTLKAFAFDILLPDESMPQFHIFHDLAELFGEEFNYDALKRLKKLLAAHPDNPKRKVSFDQEADRVSVVASNPEVIWLVAQVINENCIEQYKTACRPAEYSEILSTLKSWKRPKPKKWETGDFFTIELSNGEKAFGQVLSKSRSSYVIGALLEAKSDTVLSVEELSTRRVVSVMSLGYGDRLDKGVWKVIGTGPRVATPSIDRSPGGNWALEWLAEAYFGLAPWNAGYFRDNCFFDKLLSEGVSRPANCLWLSEEERAAYRAKHGITA